MKRNRTLLLFVLLAALLATSGCTSTRTVDGGVTIEKKRNDIPFVPFF